MPCVDGVWPGGERKQGGKARKRVRSMSRCVIHIGMRKTGSSSIQQSLNGFVDGTFAYADINGHPNHGGPLYSLFADDPGRLGSHRRTRRSSDEIAEYIRDARKGLERSIEHAGGKTIIYSGEVCSHLFTRSGLCRLRDYFAGRFERVDIVAYIRPPAAYIGSNFQQRVKDAARRIALERDYFEYRTNLSKFDEIFGREHVQFWKFDPGAFPGGCVVRDFCSRLGIELPFERIVRANESLSREAVALIYTYRKLGRDMGSISMTGPENRGLVRQLMDIGRTPFRFSPDVLRPVLEKNRADIEWMEARLGQSLHEELGEHRPGDVRDDSDLLKVKPELANKLLALLGDRAPAGVTGATPEQVAVLIHALRGQ